MPQIFIGHFEVARETGFRGCVDRIALWGCFVDEFWSSEFLPFWYFLEKHNRANKLKIKLEVVDRTTYTNTVYWQKGLHYDTNFTVLLNADSAVFDDSSLPASKCLNPISFAQARKCCIIPNSTKVLIMWLAGKMRHIPCSHWLTEEARWGGALGDETNTAECDTKIDKIKLVWLFKFLGWIYFLA